LHQVSGAAVFVPELRKELQALKDACATTGSLLQSLTLTRDEGMRGMEEVAGNVLPDDSFATPFGNLRLFLRPSSSAKRLRHLDPLFPPSLHEVIDQLSDWIDNRLVDPCHHQPSPPYPPKRT
jgi:hypothetical protein